ncbi:MAG: ferrous iron transport protein A [Candidatus Aminicenantes bacterium]|nr:ferrous iron transport protein A [Candidatus Aminicenantes bacterium]
MKTISLNLVPSGIPYKIIEIKSGLEAKKKLLAMGIHVGDAIIKLNHSGWSPVLIRNVTTRSSKIAIGRGLAGKILVGDDQL